MTCDDVQPQLTAFNDGELPPGLAAEVGAHLASCSACAEARTELEGVARMASAWAISAPDITDRVTSAVAPDDAVLDELHQLRAEMRALREEVAALRRHLPRPFDPPLWTPPSRSDTPRMENDPWNSTRS